MDDKELHHIGEGGVRVQDCKCESVLGVGQAVTEACSGVDGLREWVWAGRGGSSCNPVLAARSALVGRPSTSSSCITWVDGVWCQGVYEACF